MGVTYSLRLSEEYVTDAARKDRARSAARWWLWPIKAICGAGLLALVGVGIWARSPGIVAFPAFFLFLLLLGPRIDYYVMRRRWRRIPHFNEEMKVEVAEQLVSSASAKGSSTAAWSSYVSAVEHRDGLMLYNAPWHFTWLPDNAIASGTADEARAIVRAAIVKYHVV
jgi:hypothetical protein